jgi:hypothetical protein
MQKSVLIFDLRVRNALEGKPPSSRLPTLQNIATSLSTAPSLPLYFTKLDIYRYFDSLTLPRSMYHPFLFEYHGNTYDYTRLPFGWSYAPTIAQRMAEHIVRNVLHNIRHQWTRVYVYLDDWLIASTSKDVCSTTCQQIIRAATSLGLLINNEKTITLPSTSVSALGAHITTDPHLVVRPLQTNVFSTILQLIRKPLTTHMMLRIAGSLLWRDSRILPFLTPLYSRISRNQPGRLHQQDRQLLATAATVATRGTLYPGVWASIPYPIHAQHTQHKLIYCDASSSRGLAALVLTDCTYRRYHLPRYILSLDADRHRLQQTAELYAIYKSVHFALRHFPSTRTIIVSDSASALWGTVRLSPGITNPIRATILRRISRLLHTHQNFDISFAYLRTQLHPADPLTFPHYNLAAVASRLSHVDTLIPPPGRPARPTLRLSCIIPTRSSATYHVVRFSPDRPLVIP